MNKPKKIRITKKDCNRIVLSETIPGELPIIFSNEGFYRHLISKNKCFVFNCIVDPSLQKDYFTIPFCYKVTKDESSLRELSLMHPFSQFRFIDFYSKYGKSICYYTSRSDTTLRAPKKIGSSYYYKNENDNLNKYKNRTIDTIEKEEYIKNPTSYFSYVGYRRKHDYFDSEEFLNYEKKYSLLWLLDVTKCFPSIYTHTITWAIKNKDFVKSHLDVKNTFGNNFDSLMQKCNYKETSGILIGPEVSRIFAEIIFQDIDLSVVKNLKDKHDLKYKQDYVFKRYVDDYFIFTNNKQSAKMVSDIIADQLLKYKLYINQQKIEKYERPFYTQKSKIIGYTSDELNNFIERFTKIYKLDDNKRTIIPTNIFRYDKLKNNFISSIKAICVGVESGFAMASGYLISSLVKRIVGLIEKYDSLPIEVQNKKYYKDAITLIIETMFYFYSIAPSVGASNKLSQAIILSCRFFDKYIPEHSESIKNKILELSFNFLNQNSVIGEVIREGFVPLEKLNIVIAISELGDNYLLPNKFIESLFDFNNISDLSYFESMTCLFYIKNHLEYKSLKEKLKK
jgi:hypothetical protein